MNRSICYRKAAYQLCGFLFTLPQIAVGNNSAMLTVKVTVVATPCVINDNQAITVEFKNLVASRVDGNNYRMPVEYTLDCKDAASSAVKLQVLGTPAEFDSRLLQTSNPSALGIQLLNGATKFPVNSWLNFTYPNKPELWAVPVKADGVTLSPGEFAATATMKVEYQ